MSSDSHGRVTSSKKKNFESQGGINTPMVQSKSKYQLEIMTKTGRYLSHVGMLPYTCVIYLSSRKLIFPTLLTTDNAYNTLLKSNGLFIYSKREGISAGFTFEWRRIIPRFTSCLH